MMQKLFTTENRVFLYLLQARLANEGIDSIIKNEAPAGPAAGDVPPVVAKPEIWIIHDEDTGKAQAVLDNILQQQNQTKSDWQCPDCHEILEGQFDICWNCGHNRII